MRLFALYLSRSTPPAIDLSTIEQRLNALEAKKEDDILKLPQPQQATLASAYQQMATLFEVYRLDQKLQAPPSF